MTGPQDAGLDFGPVVRFPVLILFAIFSKRLMGNLTLGGEKE